MGVLILNELEESKKALFRALRKYPIITYKNYSLFHSGKKGDDYFDIDRLISHLEEQISLIENLTLIIKALQNEGLDFNKLVFIEKSSGPIGMLPIATSLSQNLGVDFVTIRLKHNLRLLHTQVKGWIEKKNQYPLYPGDKVLLIDDVITTGHTQLDAIKLIGKFKAEVVGIAVALIREEKAVDEIKDVTGIKFVGATFTHDELATLGYILPSSKELFTEDYIEKISKKIFKEDEDKAIEYSKKLNHDLDKEIEMIFQETGFKPSEQIKKGFKNLYITGILNIAQIEE